MNTITKDKLKHNNSNQLNIFGIAKHICGCALDLSVQCLINLNNLENSNSLDNIKGLCFATCCHQRSEINCIPNLNFYMDYLGLFELDIIMLTKATSWYFGPINNSNESNEVVEDKVMEKVTEKGKSEKIIEGKFLIY